MSNHYYIRAIRGHGTHAEWRPLVGPFSTHKAAQGMLMPTERACQRAGVYKNCTFGVWRTTKTLKPKMPLHWLSLDDIIEASRKLIV